MNIIGKKLSKGDTIGVIAMSSTLFEVEKIDIGVKHLESLGYNVVLAPNLKDNVKYFSGSVETRVSELMRFFADPSIDMIMALRGGFGAIQILDLIDYDVIKNNPKIFVGFSDLTSFLQALHKKTGLVGFYGPMLTSNFGDPDHDIQTDEWLVSLLSGEKTVLCEEFDIVSSVDFNEVEGTILGGNLITFMSLMGTKYQPDLKDSILFFEDIGEKSYAIDRALSQLLLNEKIGQVKAFVFGDFNDCPTRNEHEEELFDLIKNKLSPLNIPVITGVPSGHCHPMMTLPIGSSIKITPNSISLAEQVVQ